MLYFIAVWVLLLLTCGSIGVGVLHALRAENIERAGDRFIVATWLGIIVLSIALLATSLTLALSPLVGGVVAIGLTSLSLFFKQIRQELVTRWIARPRLAVSVFFVVAVLVSILTTQQVTWHDTGYYHYGVIQWLSEFGSVPGVALLFSNLGFTSSWLSLAAPFNADFLESRVSAVTNGFVFLIFVLQFLISLIRGFSRRAELSDGFVIVYSIILFLVLTVSKPTRSILISPSPDAAIILLVGVIAWMILILSKEQEPALSHSKYELNAETIPLILAAGAVTIKLTALPLLFISGLFYIFSKGFRINRIFIGGAIAVLLLSPMCASSIVTSGCPLYPSSFLCLDLPWSPSADAAESIARNTHRWTDWSIYASSDASTNSWFWALVRFIQSRRGQLILLLIFASILSASFTFKLLIQSRFRKQIWILTIGISGIGFIMLTAPWFRFFLPYLILLPSLLVAVACETRLNKTAATIAHKSSLWFQSKSNFRSKFLPSLFLASLTSIIFIGYTNRPSIFLPPPLQRAEVALKRVNDITYLSPVGGQDDCWATEIPCALHVPENVMLLEPSRGIAGGFMRKR